MWSLHVRRKFSVCLAISLLASVLPPLVASATAQYQLVSLVANETDLGHRIPKAAHLDPQLANAWGLAYGATSPFWIADEYTGFSTLYTADGTKQSLVVTVNNAPGDPLPPGSPTGIVANPTTGFMISQGGVSGPARFIFATLDGTIAGWNPQVDPLDTVIALDNSSKGAAYTGLDIQVGISSARSLTRTASRSRSRAFGG
jgi:uncharacterized protein (TIGR03118 family)